MEPLLHPIHLVLIQLALATGVPMSEWQTAEEILTALEILKEQGNGKG